MFEDETMRKLNSRKQHLKLTIYEGWSKSYYGYFLSWSMASLMITTQEIYSWGELNFCELKKNVLILKYSLWSRQHCINPTKMDQTRHTYKILDIPYIFDLILYKRFNKWHKSVQKRNERLTRKIFKFISLLIPTVFLFSFSFPLFLNFSKNILLRKF